LYEYTANDTDELTITKGDALVDITPFGNEGWVTATVLQTGATGSIPATYVGPADGSPSALSQAAPVGLGKVSIEAINATFAEAIAMVTTPTSSPTHPKGPSTAVDGAITAQEVWVALYDYSAKDTDEVSFTQGDLLVDVVPGSDGWMSGVVVRSSATGLFPASYIVLQSNSNPTNGAYTASSKDAEGRRAAGAESVAAEWTAAVAAGAIAVVLPPSTDENKAGALAVLLATGPVWSALYAFTANASDEISFIEGDLFIDVNPYISGWVVGTCTRTGATGSVPADYVEQVTSLPGGGADGGAGAPPGAAGSITKEKENTLADQDLFKMNGNPFNTVDVVAAAAIIDPSGWSKRSTWLGELPADSMREEEVGGGAAAEEVVAEEEEEDDDNPFTGNKYTDDARNQAEADLEAAFGDMSDTAGTALGGLIASLSALRCYQTVRLPA
jgi:hypothetical protein